MYFTSCFPETSGGYNYVAFDIGNHFCEYAGFDFDLEKWRRSFCSALNRSNPPLNLGSLSP